MSGIAFHNQIVASEYARWGKSIGAYDPYLTKWTIGLHEVLQAHFLLVDFFHDVGEGIGGAVELMRCSVYNAWLTARVVADR